MVILIRIGRSFKFILWIDGVGNLVNVIQLSLWIGGLILYLNLFG